VEVYAEWAMAPGLALVAIVTTLGLLGTGIVAGFLRARRRVQLAAAAERSIDSSPPLLVEGVEVVLSGVVRHFKDHDVAVKVSVIQTGSEAESSGSWSHSWTEIDRAIVVKPFLLELANGKTVLVEPPRDVQVADALDQKVWINRTRRVLSAELVPGERIYARGRVERSDQASPTGAYRDVQWGWALRPAGGQMLLSSEPLGAGLRQRAAFHRRYAVIGIAVLIATQVSLVSFYGRLTGRTQVATVTDTRYYQTRDDDGDTDDHYVLGVRGETVEVDEDDFKRIQKGTRVEIRIDSPRNWNLGKEATITWLHGGLLVLASLIFTSSYRGRRRSSRPWFRRKVNDTGSGRLPDSG
jgi:hypothetical protein